MKFVRDNGLEPSGRAAEELVKICLELPSDHDPVCGFPKDGESYSVVENQSCVTKQAGLTSHAVVAKAEKRARSHDDTGGDADTGTGSGTSAQ